MNSLKRSILALVATVALLPGGAFAATPSVPGDLNGDGKITIADAQMALSLAVGNQQATGLTAVAADISPLKADGSFGDGKITVADAIAVLRLAVGLDVVANYAKDSGGESAPTSPTILPAVSFSLTTARGTYGVSDPVPFTVSVRNNTSADVKWNFTNSCQVDLTVKNEKGDVVWHPTDKCLDVLTSLNLKPGEQKDWNYTWEENPDLDQLPRQPGTYLAAANLVGTDLGASINFQVSDGTTPVPPYEGPVTFDLTPGRGDHYANLTRGAEEDVIRYLHYEKVDDKVYTKVSLVPDGMRDVLLRLDSDNNLWERHEDGQESIRLKLNAKKGETWDFGWGGSNSKATLISRNATLKTPAGLFTGLLEFDFFVGPDAGWTEFVHPKGYWVGYSRNSIAGPVNYGLTNRDFTGFPVSSDNTYSAVLTPGYVQAVNGDKIEFNLIVVDANGVPVKELPGPVTWRADEQIGTIDQNGVLSVTLNKIATKGLVSADLVLKNTTITATAVVGLGVDVGGGTGSGGGVVPVPPDRQARIWIDPGYANVLPGASQQFLVHLLNSEGEEIKPVSVNWNDESIIGAIDQNGLFTAADVKGVGGAVTAEVKTGNGDEVLTLYAKVYVGPIEDPGPVDPGRPDTYRLDIEPRYAYPKSGEQIQFTANLIQPIDGKIKYSLKWSLKPENADLGTITEDGLFTAGKDGATGPVYVQAIDTNGNVLAEDYAKAYIGGTPPIVEPGGPVDGGPVEPAYRLDIEPRYSYPQPGEQVQFNAKLATPDGSATAYTLVWHLDADSGIGSITPEGLFTAGTKVDAQGPVYVQAILPDGKVVIEDYAKVWVGGKAPTPTPEPPTPNPGPAPNTRLAYLDGGNLRLFIPETFRAEPLFEAEVTGYLPNPGWSFDRWDVKVDGDNVYLYPYIINKDPGAIVPQHTVPLDESVMVNKLEYGHTYTVVVVGQDTKLVGQIKI